MRGFAYAALIGAVLLFSLDGSAAAAGGRSVSPWPHEVSDLPVDTAVSYGRLPNGFGYVLMKNTEPKDRVSMHLVVLAGSLHESDDQLGVAHFLEHMQFNGSRHFKPGELVRFFQSIGMAFGPDANARTGFDKTVYDVVLPDGSPKRLAEGLLVLRDYADGALLLNSEIDRERGIILAEMRSRDSVDYRTFVTVLEFEFPEARLSRRLPIGTESVIWAVDRRVMKSFYDDWYRPEKMFLVIVGDFDDKAVVSQISSRFSDMTARSSAPPEPELGRIAHEGEKAFYHYEAEAGSTTVAIEMIRQIEKTNDSISFRKGTYLQEIAGQVVQNRLSEITRTPGSPFTSARIQSGRYLGEIESAEISVTCAPENWEASLSRIEQELRAVLAHGFTEAELARVKKDYLANLDNAVRQAATRKSRDLAQGIIQSVADNQVHMSPLQERNLFAPFIESLVPGEVHAAFKELWAPGHRLYLVTGNAKIEPGVESPEAGILAVVQESKKTVVSRPVEATRVQFPYLDEPVPSGKIIKRENLSALGIIRVEFDNGVRLNLKKTDFEAGKMHAVLAFGEGSAGEPNQKSGLSVLAGNVVNESGLGAMTEDELSRALAGKEIQVNLDISEDHFSFTGEAASQDVKLLFQLLFAHLTDTAFRPEAYELVMAQVSQMYQSLQRDIDGVMQLAGRRFLAGGDSRFGLPEREHFERLSLSDVRKWLEKPLRESPIELSIVGDVDEDSVIELARIFFGSLEKRVEQETSLRRELPKFPEGGSLSVPVKTEIQKGMVVIAYPTTDFWDIRRTRRLSVLGDIFSEKLRETVREKLGVSYSPYAYNRSSRAYPGYGILQAVIYIAPKQAPRVIDEVRKIGEQLAAAGVTPDELRRSIGPIVTSIKEMRRTNAYWLKNVLVGSVRHPQQIEWSRSIIDDYLSITTAEIKELAGLYLQTDKAARIEAYPAPNDDKSH